MKNKFIGLFFFALSLQSTYALAQSHVDNSYGFLNPAEIYAQDKYFSQSRLDQLRQSNALPTKLELLQLQKGMAQTKQLARAKGFNMRIIPVMAGPIVYPAISFVVWAATFTVSKALSYCTGHTPYGINVFSSFAAGMTLNSALNLLVTDPGTMDTALLLLGGAKPTDALMELEAQYVGHKHLIPAALQTQAEEMLFGARLGGVSAASTQNFVGTLIGIRKAQTRSCPIKREWKEIESRLEKSLARNSSELRNQILNLAYSHYQNSSSDSSLSRLVAYLNGPFGTGKSRAASLIADAFGIPTVTLPLAGLSPKELWGTAASDSNYAGALLIKLAELGCNSGVIIFEDIDHALEGGPHADAIAASLLDLFDTTQKGFWSPLLLMQVNTSKTLMILTGNSEFGKKALADRVDMINFEDFDKATKADIILNEYLPSRLLELAISAEEFAGEKEKLKKQVDENNSTGLRSLHKLTERALADFSRQRRRLQGI